MDKKTDTKFIKFIEKTGFILCEKGINNFVKKVKSIEPNGLNLFLAIDGEKEIFYINLKQSINYPNIDLSNIIEFTRSFEYNNGTEKILRRGRLYIKTNYYDNNNILQEKNEEFVKWYESLTRWIKKNCPMTEYVKYNYTYKDYMSPEIKRLVDEEGYILG